MLRSISRFLCFSLSLILILNSSASAALTADNRVEAESMYRELHLAGSAPGEPSLAQAAVLAERIKTSGLTLQDVMTAAYDRDWIAESDLVAINGVLAQVHGDAQLLNAVQKQQLSAEQMAQLQRIAQKAAPGAGHATTMMPTISVTGYVIFLVYIVVLVGGFIALGVALG